MRPAWPRAMPGDAQAEAGGAMPGCGDAWPSSLPSPWTFRAAGQGGAGQESAGRGLAADCAGPHAAADCAGPHAAAGREAPRAAGDPAHGPAEGPVPDRASAKLHALADALIGLTRTEAEGRVAALAPGAGGVACACQPLRLAFRTAGPLRPGTVPRVVRARWRSQDVLDVVCAGFLPAPGGSGPRDPEGPEVRS